MNAARILILSFVVLSAGAASGADSTFTITKLTDRIYQLTTDEGAYTTNSLVSVGDDGLLLVDSNWKVNAEKLRGVIESFGKGTPKYIINTHRHSGHIGGNAIFCGEPVIIAHELVRSKLRSGSCLFDEFSDETMADIGLTDSLTLYFNGEKIRLVTVAGSHDDNEIMVHFTDSKVAHISSLVNGLNFPSVDSDGDPLKFADLVGRTIELLPDDVTIVSGHNGNCTRADLYDYRDMLIATTDLVRTELAAGKDIETIQAEHPLAEYEAYNTSYVSPAAWLATLAGAIEPEPVKEEIFEPMYYALRDGGAAGGIAKYRELQAMPGDRYELSDMALLVIADKLREKGRFDEAAALLALCIEEYPEGPYLYYAHYELAVIYKEQADIKTALRHCETAVEMKPEFQTGAKLLEELRNM